MNHNIKKLTNTFMWLLFCSSAFIASLGASWQINSQFNFAYSSWYDRLDIKEHILTFAPQNRFNKQHFASTDKKQHVALFQQVVRAINNDGKGLENIRFTSQGKITRLFTHDEVGHLNDVANVVNAFLQTALIASAISVLLAMLYISKRLPVPSTKLKIICLATVVIAVVMTFVLVGFKRLFKLMHDVVFADGYPWFFYYQDSLMSTFMKAPDLFASIAVNLVVVAIAVFSVYCALVFAIQRRFSTSH
ncbi:DUF1461 domain-containing protein [Thalassotalea ponticola]|uniref:lipoprotein intramolecular transacylase Lit n=1 Tax=Thalassotalea ponticola TaxID=1523392 RepID=UPI0025B51C4E|nr:DUF1461 domain-containing protein [Thalassotalea ponticola]MDN3651744.1 DUF1461 domain-containing protein [Thalassotalea ponticola]